MNCKPGDLAVIVRSDCGNEGRIVTCIRLTDHGTLRKDGQLDFSPTWEVDANFESWAGGGRKARYISDWKLRPLRPGEGEDETLTWAGKPEQVTA